MAQLTLHIGLHKTGTSTIQHFLHRRTAEIEAAGWVYPSFLHSANHVEVPFAFVITDRVLSRDFPELATAAGRGAKVQWLDAKFSERVRPGSKWVVSCEEFNGLLAGPQLGECIHFLRGHFRDINAVLYLRRPDYLIGSVYSEMLKEAPFFDMSMDIVDGHPRLFEQAETVRRWESVLGAGRIAVRPYLESFKVDSNAVIADFCRTLELPLRLPDLSRQRIRRNGGLSQDAVSFLRATAPDVESCWALVRAGREAALADSAVGRMVRSVMVAGDEQRSRRRLVRAVRETITSGGPPAPDPVLLAQLRARYHQPNQVLAKAGNGPGWKEWLDQAAPLPQPIAAMDPLSVAAFLEELTAWKPAVKRNPAVSEQPRSDSRRPHSRRQRGLATKSRALSRRLLRRLGS